VPNAVAAFRVMPGSLPFQFGSGYVAGFRFTVTLAG
jgi:hypothetical protein